MKDVELTLEQMQLAHHQRAAFVEACPGAGKTLTIAARLGEITKRLLPRTGVAFLSFTNSAVEAFIEQCSHSNLNTILKFPNFVGTFDSFLRQFLILPSGIDGVTECPTVIDSWSTLDIQVRLRGKNAFRGAGVNLDCFDPSDNSITPESVGHRALQAHVRGHLAAYVQEASRFRLNLRRSGYLSAADARVEISRRIQNQQWAVGLGMALSARFAEMIVDEAQDCNPLDLKILAWLRSCGLPVTVVCDPDQAIYGFRFGDPANLREFSAQFASCDRLPLTGNFRSSKPICALAATLRARSTPDVAVGPYANEIHPVQILEYHGRTVPVAVGRKFNRLVEDAGIESRGSILLGHKRTSALRASGSTSVSGTQGSSRVETLANAIGGFWSSFGSNRAREDALRTVEKTLLALMGKLQDHELPSRAAERHGINTRWLRRTALQLLMRLPRSCPDSVEGCKQWLEALRHQIKQLGLKYPPRVSEAKYFPQPRTSGWHKQLTEPDSVNLRCSTIHEAKGRQYEAVCVVIPPDTVGFNHTSQLFQAWETRTDYEGKRVLYVGLTRARRILALALPDSFSKRLTSILDNAGVSYVLHSVR